MSVPVPESTWKARPEGTDYDAVRQRLVDATEDLLRKGGVGALRQDAVAEGAGLHRSSVYRYFNSKEDLVIAAVVQSTLRIGRRIRERIGETADPENFLVRGIVEALEAMSADPLHRALTTPGSSRAMTRLANTALREGVRPLVEPMFASAAERGVLRRSERRRRDPLAADRRAGADAGSDRGRRHRRPRGHARVDAGAFSARRGLPAPPLTERDVRFIRRTTVSLRTRQV